MDQPTHQTSAERAAAAGTKIVNLALQGGGSHGAFTWGVLDRLLEEDRLEFDGITGTSAGAVNAVVLADGLATGGARARARRCLSTGKKCRSCRRAGLWRRPCSTKLIRTTASSISLGFIFLEPLTYFASPYQMNPLNINPFKNLLAEAINFERVRRQTAVKLFLCATDVQTAKVKIFNGNEIGVEHLLASTCLPLLMQAVEIDGEFYWDGSYAGNPAIFPLVYECSAHDILMVHITPAERPGVPTTSPAIMNRMQEISFNTALIREMRTITFLNRLVDEGRMDGGKRLLVHLIEAEDLIRGFSWSSRLNSDWGFLMHLYQLGRGRAEQWLSANFDRIGVESTIDLHDKYF